MLLELFAVSIFVAAILAWNNWRRGVLLLIVIGTLQDPIRKLTPDLKTGVIVEYATDTSAITEDDHVTISWLGTTNADNSFLSKAPEAVVNKEKDKLQSYKDKVNRLEKELSLLG